MASEMGWKSGILLLLFIAGLTWGHVEMESIWRPADGWSIKCSWRIFANDSLQSVRLFRNGIQYAIFRPEVNGLRLEQDEPAEQFHLKVMCNIETQRGQTGKCLSHLRLKSTPAEEDVYMCEVSGERPTFRLEKEVCDAFVTPSDAVVTRIDVPGDKNMLNCTSSGIPSPSLVWTIDGREIPADFGDYYWNSKTKFWDSWSAFRVQNDETTPVCTPLITTKSRETVAGKAGVVNRVARLCATKTLAVVLILTTFLR